MRNNNHFKLFSHKILYGLMVIALLILSVKIVAFSNGFYKKQYETLSTASNMNLSEEDLTSATRVLLDYIKGDVDSIDLIVNINNQETEMFNQKEKNHMVDVKNIYTVANIFMLSVLIIFSFIFIKDVLIKKQFILHERKAILKHVYLVLGIVFGILIVFVLTNFDLFWTLFHKVLFTNDLWLLDPRTDRMINMFPLPFFNAMVMRIIVWFIGMNIVLAGFYLLEFNKEGKL